MCKQIHSSSGRMISSRLKYSRNALHINVPPFARYFRQRFAPFSATGGGRKATPTNPLKRISLINKFKKFNIKSVLLRLKYLRRVSESVF